MAFDWVGHVQMLQHLPNIEMCLRLLAWMHIYMTGRRQGVMANGTYSV